MIDYYIQIQLLAQVTTISSKEYQINTAKSYSMIHLPYFPQHLNHWLILQQFVHRESPMFVWYYPDNNLNTTNIYIYKYDKFISFSSANKFIIIMGSNWVRGKWYSEEPPVLNRFGCAESISRYESIKSQGNKSEEGHGYGSSRHIWELVLSPIRLPVINPYSSWWRGRYQKICDYLPPINTIQWKWQ